MAFGAMTGGNTCLGADVHLPLDAIRAERRRIGFQARRRNFRTAATALTLAAVGDAIMHRLGLANLRAQTLGQTSRHRLLPHGIRARQPASRGVVEFNGCGGGCADQLLAQGGEPTFQQRRGLASTNFQGCLHPSAQQQSGNGRRT
jgi:hypothetical protein